MPGLNVVGGNIRFPSLQSMADLFRSLINDDMSGATDTPGEGQIATNTSPFLLSFMNSAIRDVYSDLRNVGDPELILDNYLLIGIPPIAVENPAVRVTLSYAGFNNGFTWNSAFTLPISCERVIAMWERLTNTNDPFAPMDQVQALPGGRQHRRMGCWAMEQNAVVMPGCLQEVDLRMRMRITFPDFLNPATLDFSTAYVPILSCQNAVVSKMLVLYAKRFAPEQYQMAVAEDARFIDKLKLEVVRQQQSIASGPAAFGEEATGSIGAWYYSQL
jgi:hypothetical protein